MKDDDFEYLSLDEEGEFERQEDASTPLKKAINKRHTRQRLDDIVEAKRVRQELDEYDDRSLKDSYYDSLIHEFSHYEEDK